MRKGDRDRSVEQLLRGSHAPDREARDEECPDAETLAALAEAALGATVRRDVEAHLADCHRCQALMAAMVRAEPTPAGAGASDAAAAFWWWRNRRSLGWFATAAVATLAVALWVAVPGEHAPLSEEARSQQQAYAPTRTEPVAALPAAPAAEPPTTILRDAPQAVADQQRADAKPRTRPDELATLPGRTASAPAPAKSLADTKLGAPAEGSAEAKRSRELDEVRQESDQGGRARNEGTAPVPERTLEARTAPAAPAVGTRSAVGALTAASFEVTSPDPKIRWRIGPGPTVQYSTDGGATWARQQAETDAALSAGSAASPAVCWLVGAAGTVLRTTDGGQSWQRVPFPETTDLISVNGTSALNATVQLADRRRFGTSDGGRTWIPVRE